MFDIPFFTDIYLRTADVFLVVLRVLGSVLNMSVTDFLNGFTWDFSSILFYGDSWSFTMPKLSFLITILKTVSEITDFFGKEIDILSMVSHFTVFHAGLVIFCIISAVIILFGALFKLAKLIMIIGG